MYIIRLFISLLVIWSSDVLAQAPTMTWSQLAEHAGLINFRERKAGEFKVDVFREHPRHIQYLRAEIDVNQAEWDKLMAPNNDYLLSRWQETKMGSALWQSVVRIGCPGSETVSTDRLKAGDPYIVFYQDAPASTRLYMLSVGQEGRGGTLYYFFTYGQKVPSK